MKMMVLMGLEVTLRIYESYSLKDKRSIVKSIVERSHRKYNVSSAEVDEMDMLNKAVIWFGVVSNNRNMCRKILQNIVNDIDRKYQVEIIETEWIDY